MYPPPEYRLIKDHMAEMERLATDRRAAKSARAAKRTRAPLTSWLRLLLSDRI